MEEKSRGRSDLDFILEIRGGFEGRRRKKNREKERRIIPENEEPSNEDCGRFLGERDKKES